MKKITRYDRGFTLIELLTVIAIIAILAAILMPTLTRVREAANSAHCTNNLRSMAAAVQAFAHDNNDRYPMFIRNGHVGLDADNIHPFGGYSAGNYHGRQWDAQLARYLDMPSPFDFTDPGPDPANPGNNGVADAWNAINSFDHPFWCRSTEGVRAGRENPAHREHHAQSSYTYNPYLGGASRSPYEQDRYPTLSSVQYPMLIPMMYDFSWPVWAWGGAENRSWSLFLGSSNPPTVDWFRTDMFWSMIPRHGGRANILFADFSVQQREMVDNTIPLPRRVMLFDGNWNIYVE